MDLQVIKIDSPLRMQQKPSILLIHNTYLQKGGEDSVVAQELDCLQKEGYLVHSLFFNNSQKGIGSLLRYPFQLFFNLSAFVKVYRLVKKERIAIVHVHNYFYIASPAVFWAAKAAGAKTVMTLHNYRLFCLNGLLFYNNQPCTLCPDQQSFNPGIQRKCFKESGIFSRALAWSNRLHQQIQTFSKKIDRFVVINPLQEQLLLNKGIPANKIIYKPNFFKGFDHQTPPPFETRDDFYLYVGRLNPEKGIQELVQAFKENGKKLRIVGDGPLADWVKSQIGTPPKSPTDNTNNSTTSQISYTPALPRESLAALYQHCKALILPSRWYEGQPMTVIEAQSTGAIVIAADSPNMKRMVNHGVNGFLYPLEPSNQLNEVIHIFEARSVEANDGMSKAAYQQFLRSYTEEQHINALKLLYHFESSSKQHSNQP